MKNKIIQTISYYKPKIIENIESNQCYFYLGKSKNLKHELVRSYHDIYGNLKYDVVSNEHSHDEIKEIEWDSNIDAPINSKINIDGDEYLVNDKVYNLDNTITYYVEDCIEKCDNYDEIFEELFNELTLNKKKNYKKLYTTIDIYHNKSWFNDTTIYKIKNNENGYECKIKFHELYKYENQYYWDGEYA